MLPAPAAQSANFLSYYSSSSRIFQEKSDFFQKNLEFPLYKSGISGIIIIVRCASVAQSVEQGTENPRVIGSIPIGGTSQETQQGFQYAAVAHLVERHLAKVEVASSSLVGRSNTKPSSMRSAKMMAFLFDSRSGKVCRC